MSTVAVELPPLLPRSAEPLPRTLGLPCIDSASLFRAGQPEVLIRHGDQLYRLRLTRQGKLLLQK